MFGCFRTYLAPPLSVESTMDNLRKGCMTSRQGKLQSGIIMPEIQCFRFALKRP